MHDVLRTSELLLSLTPAFQAELAAIAEPQSLARGEYLFLLGDHADRLYTVLAGRMEVCFPLSLGGAVRDVTVETIEPGGALGLSALVKPYRFTLSARAGLDTELASFARDRLVAMLDVDLGLGRAFMGRLTEVLGRRLLTMQALWGRELQRSLSARTKVQPPEHVE